MVEFEKVAVLDIKQTSNTAWILKVSFHKYYTLIIIWKIREILEYLKLTDLNIIHFLYNEHTKFFFCNKNLCRYLRDVFFHCHFQFCKLDVRLLNKDGPI